MGLLPEVVCWLFVFSLLWWKIEYAIAATSSRETLLVNNYIIHLRRKARSRKKFIGAVLDCAGSLFPQDTGLASAATFSRLHLGYCWAFPPIHGDSCAVRKRLLVVLPHRAAVHKTSFLLILFSFQKNSLLNNGWRSIKTDWRTTIKYHTKGKSATIYWWIICK